MKESYERIETQAEKTKLQDELIQEQSIKIDRLYQMMNAIEQQRSLEHT